LGQLRAIEAKSVRAAKRVFPSVVGVNNSAGIIVSREGLVLTAAHLGGLRQDTVTVRLHDGRQLKAKTLGIDGQHDAAMVKIEGEGPFPFVENCGTPVIGLDGRALGISIARMSGPASYALPVRVIAAEVAK